MCRANLIVYITAVRVVHLLRNGTIRCKFNSHWNVHNKLTRCCTIQGASEASEETKHWRGKRLFVNNGLPLQCFVCSEPADAAGTILYSNQYGSNINISETHHT